MRIAGLLTLAVLAQASHDETRGKRGARDPEARPRMYCAEPGCRRFRYEPVADGVTCPNHPGSPYTRPGPP